MTTVNTPGNIDQEYRAAKEGAAIFDLSHWGLVKATGKDTLDLLNRLSTNNVVDLKHGQGAPTILTSDKGRIIDLIYVYNLGPFVLLTTSPGATKPVMEWIDKYTIMDDSVLEDLSQNTSLLTITGPQAAEAVGKLAGTEVTIAAPFGSAQLSIGDMETWVLRWKQGGIEGYHLFAPSNDAAKIWKSAVSSGARPAGVQAWEMLRVDAGVPAYDKELGERFNPLEAGLIGAVDFAKGCYVGQEVIARLDTYKKVQRHLVRLSFKGADSINEGAILLHDDKEVGEVTSAAKLPGGYKGLGYVRGGLTDAGAHLTLRGGGKAIVFGLSQLFGPGK